MSRQFSIPTVLRMAPNALLMELFTDLDYAELDRDWHDLKEREIEPVLQAIRRQPAEVAARLESELRDLFDLACDSGIDSILEAAALCGFPEFADALPASVGAYHKALWTRLRHPDVFERALRIQSFQSLSWWRKRNDLPSKTITVTEDLLSRLGESLAEIFFRAQGRGYPCTVEHCCEADGTDYFCAHPDDFVREVTAHDEDRRLTPVTIRTTFSVVFAYNGAEGSLELHAKAPAKIKGQLESAFCRIVLGEDLGAWESDVAYDLNVLKDRKTVLVTEPEDRVCAQIRLLRLAGNNTGRRNAVEISDDNDNIHDAIDQWIDQRNIPLDQVNVTKATLRFEFMEKGDRKPGVETVDVTWPNSCNLKGRRPERVAIIEKCLKQSKIDVSRPVAIALSKVEPQPVDVSGRRTAQAS
jgi:hypothetical protein